MQAFRRFPFRVLLGAFLASSVFVVLNVTPASATGNTLYVSSTGTNTGVNPCIITAPCQTVDEAVDFAASGDTIDVAGTIDEHVNISGPATLTVQQWPSMPAAVLDGQSTGEVFSDSATGGTLTIAGLTIQNGMSTNGGGIFAAGPLVVTGSTITNNTANGDGGIQADGGLDMTNSVVSDNHSTAADGGGIGCNCPSDSFTITSSTITGNTSPNTNALPEAGGGIFDQFGTATISDSTISGNTAFQGSGMFLNFVSATLTDDAITGNTGIGQGGGVVTASGSLQVNDSTIADNVSGFGGGIDDVFTGAATIDGSTVTGNTGGQISIDGAVTLAGDIVANDGATRPEDCNLFSGAGIALVDGGHNVADDATCAFTATGSTNSSTAIDDYLGVLGNYGGPTQTVPLLSSPSPSTPSPDPAAAVIPGANPLCTANSGQDQRGDPRLPNGASFCDIGAYEIGDPLPPTAPTATAGNSAIAVSWTDPASDGGSAITGYDVYCSTTSPPATTGTPSATVGGATATQATVTGLNNSTPYFCVVTAVNGVGASSPSSIVGATPLNVPTPPQSPVATPSNGSIGISWVDPVSNGGSAITGYDVYCQTSSPPLTTLTPTTTVSGATATSATVSGTNGTPYFCVVTAVNANGSSLPSSPVVTATPSTVPDAPPTSGATPHNASIMVGWSDPASNGGSPITGYDVYCSTTSPPATTGTPSATASGATATSAVVSGLTNGTGYFCVVTAVNANGQSVPSSPILHITPSTVPGAPTAPTATAGNSQITVGWTDPTSNGGAAITGYDVYCSTTSPPATTGTPSATASGATATSATVSSLSNGTQYFCVVTAVNVDGQSVASSPVVNATPSTVPGAPTSPIATAGNAQIGLSWTDPTSNGGSAITGYDVYCSTTSPPATTGTPSATASGATATSATVSTLSNGTQYFCVVTAVNVDGQSVASSPVVNAMPAAVPGAPTSPGVTPGNASMGVSWVDPVSNGGSPITGYDVYCSTTSPPATTGTPSATASGATATSATVSSLINGTQYFCVVTAVNANGQSLPSSPVVSATPSTVPGAPTSPTAATGNTQITVGWVAPASNGGSAITGYKVYCQTTNPPSVILTPSVTPGPSATSAVITGLTNGTQYFCVITAVNANGQSVASSPIVSTTPFTSAGPPTSPTATPGNAQITVGWVAPASNGGSAITGYRVYCQTTNPPSVILTPSATPGPSATSAVVTGLTNGTQYFCAVTAVNANGQSVASSVVSATPVAPPPPPPSPKHGYWLVGSDGGIFTFGSANFWGSTGSLKLNRPVVGITPTKDESGYWLVATDGGIFAFGDAPYVGSIPGLGLLPAGSGGPGKHLNAPIVGMVPSASGAGYFMIGSDGGVFAFGDAQYEGSCPGIGGCVGAAVGVAPDASGLGYWLVTTSGHVYTFGDAQNFGAPGPQSSNITSIVRTPDGKGYWILDANGSVFAYGSAAFLGGLPAGASGALDPATAIFTASDGGGYWVATALGKVYAFGDAPQDGDMSGTHLNGSIIAATGF